MIEIEIVNVFAESELQDSSDILRFIRRGLNTIHSNTRHYIIRRELLFDVDDPVSTDAFRETERNLRSLGFLKNIEVFEIGLMEDGRSVIRVRVQETWSLMTQLSFSRASTFTRWVLQVADSNFLGYGVKFIAGVGQNEDRDYSILHFQNRRILGTSLQLGLTRIYQSDGHSNQFGLEKPFYTQDTIWGFQGYTWDRVYEPRFYLDAHDISSTRLDEALYAKFPIEETGIFMSVNRLLTDPDDGLILRLGLGGVISDFTAYLRPDVILSDGRITSGSSLMAAENRALEREDVLKVRPLVFFEVLGRHWTSSRNVLRMGPVEDLLLDPWFRLSLGPDLMKLGDGGGQFLVQGTLQDWSRIAGGHLLLKAKGDAAFGNEKYTYHSYEILGGFFRPAGQRYATRIFVEAAHGGNLLGNRAFVLGLFRGMRTLDYDGQAGDRLLRMNVEHMLRLPGELLGLYNTGIAVHYDSGLAWWAGDHSSLDNARQEAGFGLRFGSSRSARGDVTRLDLTWPLNDSSGPKLTATTSGWF